MNTGSFVFVVAVAVIGIAVVVIALMRGGHPEQTASHHDEMPDDTTSDRFYGGADRPAGPDAEDPDIGTAPRDER